MHKFPFILIYILLVSFYSNSQQQDNWYFGRKAAVNFTISGTQPAPVKLSNSAMIADEATGSISDENGKLLFYTNGLIVYNRQHQVMLNGDNLAGDISSSQLTIVPWPGNNTLFFLFTTGSIETDFVSGYNYSIVDMSRDNGNGEVINKNNLLWQSCTERMTIVRHANGTDTWLITNDKNSNIFRSWLITCTGIQPTPVVSTIGVILDQYSSMNAGVIKASPDGKLICQTHFPIFDEFLHPANFAQVFDFDNSTGTLSNVRSISFTVTQYTHCEFSPNSKLLYLTRADDKKIDQFEISLPTIQAIKTSRISIDSKSIYYSIQSAPDDKIYLSQPSQFLSVINNPNVKGLGCNFQQDKIDLSPGSSFLGLPLCINDLSASNPNNGFSYTILDSCTGKVQFFGNSTMPGTLSWLWDFGDGSLTSALQNPIHTFTLPEQIYNVKLKVTSSISCGIQFRSRALRPAGIVADADFDFEIRCDSGYVRFINKSYSWIDGAGRFLWDFGDNTFSTEINPIHVYNLPGKYFVTLKLVTSSLCLERSLTLPLTVQSLTVMASSDQTILVGQSVQISASAPPGSSYQWSPAIWLNNSSSSLTNAMPLEDIKYKVTATSVDGCKSEDSVFIHVLQFDDIYVPSGFTPNNDGNNDELIPSFHGKLVLQEFAIFNRWGQKIFFTSQRGVGWNGKVNGIMQDTGVYVWVIRATETRNNNKHELNGTFVLIRK